MAEPFSPGDRVTESRFPTLVYTVVSCIDRYVRAARRQRIPDRTTEAGGLILGREIVDAIGAPAKHFNLYAPKGIARPDPVEIMPRELSALALLELSRDGPIPASEMKAARAADAERYASYLSLDGVAHLQAAE